MVLKILDCVYWINVTLYKYTMWTLVHTIINETVPENMENFLQK